MKRTLFLTAATVSVLALCGCNEDQQNPDGSLSSGDAQHSLSVIASLRPKASPEMMEKIRREELEKRRKAEEALAKAAQDQQQQNAAADPANRDLPAVDQSPISQIAGAFGFGNNAAQPSGQIPSPPAGMPMGMPSQVPTPPPIASYGGGYPGMGGPGLIPPPPAVSLSTSANPYSPPPDPYAAAYMQGYNPYQAPYPAYQAPPAVAGPAHPEGSMFSNHNSGGGSASAAPVEEKKRAPIALITPTGMDSRSPYKQRDELKVLIKGAFASTPVPELRDPKVNVVLARTDVGLPGESTKGAISVSQRQIDALFKNPPIDKRIFPVVKKVEADVAQAYYRYLYSYNKFMFSQQQVAARKQEMEIADSNAEKQRAAADLSTAQNDADSAKDDMRSAQTDLASICGVAAARSVIKTVSGVAPSNEALAAAEAENPVQQAAGGLMGSVQNAFGALEFWKRGKGGGEIASAEPEKPAKQKVEEPKDKKKNKKTGKTSGGGAGTEIASAGAGSSSSNSSSSEDSPPPPKAAVSQSGISFELKNVQTTPRKSVLKVTVRNNGGDNFNLDPDVISVIEGDHKLAEAAVRAEFDSTLVGPNQEVTGTITIFGRPWNDKLIVSLSDGGKTIQLHR